jgi:hypothetical protein
MIYDAGEHIKEVFAHFGRAYYYAGAMETGLACILLYLDFLAKQKPKIKAAGPQNFNRPKYDVEFDAFMKSQHAKTIGNLMKRIHELTDVEEPLKTQIGIAKARRDFLAHHFFREHAEDFALRRGRDKMLAELQDAQKLFESVECQVKEYLNRTVEQLGIPAAMLEAYTERYIKSLEENENLQNARM